MIKQLVSVPVHVPVRLFANWKSITVFVVVRVVHGLWWILLRFVMYFWCGTEALLPMMRPVVVLHCHLLGRLGVSAHCHTVYQTPHECQKAKNEEDYTQYPVRKEQDKTYSILTQIHNMDTTGTYIIFLTWFRCAVVCYVVKATFNICPTVHFNNTNSSTFYKHLHYKMYVIFPFYPTQRV